MGTQVRALNQYGNNSPGGAMSALTGDGVVRGLGWFSIGLGVTELIAPRVIARIAGTRNNGRLIRSYGLREIAAGVGILSTPRPAEWMWARVAGDALDLASLGKAAATKRNERGKTAFAIASVAGVTVLDVCCATKLSKDAKGIAAHAEGNMIVDRSPEECYSFWRNFENFPRFSIYVQSVRSKGGRLTHWVASGPGGVRIDWDSELTEDVPNERIAWRSVGESDVQHSGVVNFEPASGGRGTIVRVQTDFGQKFRSIQPIASLMGKTSGQIIRKELRRFKQVLETGETITTEGQPTGRATSTTWLDKIAR